MTRSRLEDKSLIEPPTGAGTDLTRVYYIYFFHSFLKCYITDVYTLIHSFLKDRSHTKVASSLKKAVTGIITIDDGAEYKGPTLQKILEEWRELKAAADAMCVQRPYLFPWPRSCYPSRDTSSSDSSSGKCVFG